MANEFLEIYDQNYEAIYRYTYAKVGNKWDTEDIVSEVFRKAFQKHSSVKSNARAWLFSIARNSINDYYRRSSRKTIELDETFACDQPAIEYSLEQLDELECLKKSLSAITEEDYDIISLRYFSDLKYKDMVEVLGKQSDYLRVKASRAVKKLGCIALAIILTGISVWVTPDNKVQADVLKVQNYRTYMEIESNHDLSVAEYNGILYVPDINEGIYMYDGKEKQKIYGGKVSLIRVSPDGKNLVFYENGKIGILNLVSREGRIVLESSNTTVYEEPAWVDNETILFTRKDLVNTPEYNPQQSGIYILNLINKEQNKLTAGTNGSYVKNGNLLVYQKGDKIAVLNLSSKQETIVDDGMQPSASPDGKAIAYTKLSVTYDNIEENVKIEKVIQNLWVADGENFSRKSQITSNLALENINKDEWLKSLKPSNELQMLSLGGRYCYLFPVWSKDSKSIYALRRDYANGKAAVIKIDLGRETLKAEEVADRFLQSAKLSDEDYQSSLSTVKLKGVISYSILSSGQEGTNIYYDTEVKIAREQGAAPEISKLRLYLTKQDNRFIITEIKEL